MIKHKYLKILLKFHDINSFLLWKSMFKHVCMCSRWLPEHVSAADLTQQGASPLSIMLNVCVSVSDRSVTSCPNHGCLMAVTLSNTGWWWRQRGRAVTTRRWWQGGEQSEGMLLERCVYTESMCVHVCVCVCVCVCVNETWNTLWLSAYCIHLRV